MKRWPFLVSCSLTLLLVSVACGVLYWKFVRFSRGR